MKNDEIVICPSPTGSSSSAGSSSGNSSNNEEDVINHEQDIEVVSLAASSPRVVEALQKARDAFMADIFEDEVDTESSSGSSDDDESYNKEVQGKSNLSWRKSGEEVQQKHIERLQDSSSPPLSLE